MEDRLQALRTHWGRAARRLRRGQAGSAGCRATSPGVAPTAVRRSRSQLSSSLRRTRLIIGPATIGRGSYGVKLGVPRWTRTPAQLRGSGAQGRPRDARQTVARSISRRFSGPYLAARGPALASRERPLHANSTSRVASVEANRSPSADWPPARLVRGVGSSTSSKRAFRFGCGWRSRDARCGAMRRREADTARGCPRCRCQEVGEHPAPSPALSRSWTERSNCFKRRITSISLSTVHRR